MEMVDVQVRVPFVQLILGLNSFKNGYPKTIRSCPRLVIKKSISWWMTPIWTLSQHLWVIRLAWLWVPLILWIMRGAFSGLRGRQRWDTVRWSRKHSVAPLSIRASSVFCVVDKTNFIFKAFCLVESTWRACATRVATANLSTSKNPNHWALLGTLCSSGHCPSS